MFGVLLAVLLITAVLVVWSRLMRSLTQDGRYLNLAVRRVHREAVVRQEVSRLDEEYERLLRRR